MKTVKAALSLLPALALIFLFNTKLGNIPPIGKFFDPFRGFWNNAEGKSAADETLPLADVRGNTSIAYDAYGVPHIFAGNDYDLYFAQGYVTAKDRLWQMDFQSRFAGGRLSEVVGDKAIELDRYQRRMGMVFGAENMLRELEKHPRIKQAIQAYANGVNAYISRVQPKDYPLEFKILDYKPEEWTPLNTALLLKLMSSTLAGGSDELYMSNVLKKFGAAVTSDLFPDIPFRKDPIIPEGTKWNFNPVPLPLPPDRQASAGGLSAVKTRMKDEGIGSNNWAVSGSKTATGFPLLANDPHLELSLPSIWYQVQLAAPGTNSYGVSIPGAPCIIIGFNQQAAWGVTNVDADVLDFYKVRFKDHTHREYWYNNKWNKTRPRIEKIKVRGKADQIDTVYYTHQGPVVYLDKPPAFSKAQNVPEGYALRWIAHDPSVDVATFYYLNRASNYNDYRKALTWYTAPAQNFVFADVQNDVAITANGYIPLKWRGQGKYLLDGSRPENDWHGRIPAEQNPTVKNPQRGFVSSANQPSTDASYPYYINWEFSGYERAHRINKRLSVMSGATVDSMRVLQNDNYSVLAEDILPTLLQCTNGAKFTASEQGVYDIVRRWNKYFNANEIGASVFEIWQKKLYDMIWSDEFGSGAVPMRYPSRDRTVKLLLQEPGSHWFDNVKTPGKESREELVLAAFRFAADSLERRFGPISPEWRWASVKQSRVNHLAKIGGLGSRSLWTGGSKTSVNALGESHGPSWRMVVSLGKTTKGYGVFPGGQSGNPGSSHYDDLLNTWVRGKLAELLFFHSPAEQQQYITHSLTLQKK
ncbi:penicillin acylase family protein [Arcticibacter sp. MXS-1]|uniref:penicillin acylase family protein n=1 Tax=Arcticibacter sp. MXS-1 TaxID=3341726 RepID=UPI0035A85AE8